MKVTLNINLEKGNVKEAGFISSSIEVDTDVLSLEKEVRDTLLFSAVAKLLTEQANQTQQILHQSLYDTLQSIEKSEVAILQSIEKSEATKASLATQICVNELKAFEEVGEHLSHIFAHNEEMASLKEEMMKSHEEAVKRNEETLKNFTVVKNNKSNEI